MSPIKKVISDFKNGNVIKSIPSAKIIAAGAFDELKEMHTAIGVAMVEKFAHVRNGQGHILYTDEMQAFVDTNSPEVKKSFAQKIQAKVDKHLGKGQAPVTPNLGAI